MESEAFESGDLGLIVNGLSPTADQNAPTGLGQCVPIVDLESGEGVDPHRIKAALDPANHAPVG